jgi:hypothetical protein
MNMRMTIVLLALSVLCAAGFAPRADAAAAKPAGEQGEEIPSEAGRGAEGLPHVPPAVRGPAEEEVRPHARQNAGLRGVP